MKPVWDPPARELYYIQTGTIFENPYGVPFDEACRMVAELPAEICAQVVFGKYVESSGLVFSGELISGMIDRSLEPVRAQTWIDEEAARKAENDLVRFRHWSPRYYTGVDFGRKTDFTVVHTIDTAELPAKTVYWKRLNRVPWEVIYREVGRVRSLFGPYILCDSTGPGGDVILDALVSRLYCPIHHRCLLSDSPRCVDDNGVADIGCKKEQYLPLSCVEGYHFSEPRKVQLVEHLRNVMGVGYSRDGSAPNGFGWVRTPPIPQLEEELTIYSWDDRKLQTDCVMALALAALHGLEEPLQNPMFGSVYGA
jgi:hypothetical protein